MICGSSIFTSWFRLVYSGGVDRHRETLFSSISEIFDIDNLSLDQLFITLMSSHEYDIHC